MYWSGTDYDRMAQLVIDIYVDYNIRSFPVDEKEICRKLGLKLIPYSEYPEDGRFLRSCNKDNAAYRILQ